MTWRHGVVRSLGRSWTGAQELTVQLLGDAEPLGRPASRSRARLAPPPRSGPPGWGRRVPLGWPCRPGVVGSLGGSGPGAQKLTVQLLGDDEPLEVRRSPTRTWWGCPPLVSE